MKNTDGKNLPKEAQQHNRDQAIRLFKGGKSLKEISEIVSVHPDTISKWIRKWKMGGDEALLILLQKIGHSVKPILKKLAGGKYECSEKKIRS